MYAERSASGGYVTIVLKESERRALRRAIREQTSDEVGGARCIGANADCALCVLLDLLIQTAPTEPVAPEPVDPLLAAYDG